MRMLTLAVLVAGGLSAAPAVAHPDWWDQRDRPGDFRCDAYWDRGRTDCDAAWRTRYLAHDRAYDYGHGYGYRQGRGRHVEPRPRHAPPVYRDPARIDWCAWRFRSYDPRTGYYLTYSGRYRFCG